MSTICYVGKQEDLKTQLLTVRVWDEGTNTSLAKVFWVSLAKLKEILYVKDLLYDMIYIYRTTTSQKKFKQGNIAVLKC